MSIIALTAVAYLVALAGCGTPSTTSVAADGAMVNETDATGSAWGTAVFGEATWGDVGQ